MVQTVQAQVVYENDEFHYSLGLNGELNRVPTLKERGEPIVILKIYLQIVNHTMLWYTMTNKKERK